MAGAHHLLARQLHPAEVAQGLAGAIGAVAGNAGGVEVGGAGPVAAEALAIPLAAPKGVVHVPKHHQGHRAIEADLADGQGQVEITPVAGGWLPVAAAGGGGIAAESGGAAMAQQHQGPVGGCGGGGGRDPIGRLLQAHRAEGSLHSAGKLESTAGGSRPPPHHRQIRRAKSSHFPAAVNLPQQIDLVLQGAPRRVLAGVVVAKDAGHRHGQLAQQGRNPLLTITEVAHHEQRIGGQAVQQGVVAVVPSTVQVSGNGNAERFPPAGYRHHCCLGSCHPASAEAAGWFSPPPRTTHRTICPPRSAP